MVARCGLMIAAVGFKPNQGFHRLAGLVADAAATKQGKFVVVSGAKVEIEQNAKNSPRKFATTTDKDGSFGFREIPYGHLSVESVGAELSQLRAKILRRF